MTDAKKKKPADIFIGDDAPTFRPSTLRLATADAYKNGEKAGADKERERVRAVFGHVVKELRWLRKRTVPATTCDDGEFWARFAAVVGAATSATRAPRRKR